MKVVWSPLAIERAAAEAAFIAADKPEAARKWLNGLFAAVDRLATFPLSGKAVPEIPLAEYRQLTYKITSCCLQTACRRRRHPHGSSFQAAAATERSVRNGGLTRRCTRRGAVRWPGTKVAYLLVSSVASRPVQFAPASAIVSRGTGRAAQPLASLGAARVSARSVSQTERRRPKTP